VTRRLAPFCLLTLLACGPSVAPLPDGGARSEAVAEPIINGAVDFTHEAVVYMQAKNNTACSGTIIAKNGSNAFVLTAAHCGDPDFVLTGVNINNPTGYFPALKFQRHPKWNGTPPNYDFMMIQVGSAKASTPVYPAMSPAQDSLTNQTQVRHIGYGKAGPAPGTPTSERHQIVTKLSAVYPITITYNQPNGGPCSGDSGGPQLTTTGSELVAGVTSAGDANCNVSGESGRVSAVYDTFLMPFINNSPPLQETCDQCRQGALTGSGGACAPAIQACMSDPACKGLYDCLGACGGNQSCVNACAAKYPGGIGKYNAIFTCSCNTACATECKGDPQCQGSSSTTSTGVGPSSTSVGPSSTSATGGSSTGATTGAGGAPPIAGSTGASNYDGWVAGDLQGKDHEGNVVSSGCALGGERPASRDAVAWGVVLAGAALAGRRRDRRG
jgi:hypothetical protein